MLSWNKLLGLVILGTLGSALQIRLADSIALKSNRIESRCTFIQFTEKVEPMGRASCAVQLAGNLGAQDLHKFNGYLN